MVPFEHHGWEQATSAGGDRRRAPAQDRAQLGQGRVPHAEGGRLGHLQPQHQRLQRASSHPHQVRSHTPLLRATWLSRYTSY